MDGVIYTVPSSVEIIIGCDRQETIGSEYVTEPPVTKGTMIWAVINKCNRSFGTERYSLEFSTAYSCLERAITYDAFMEMVRDPSCNCALVSDSSLLATIKRKFKNAKLSRRFVVATSGLLSYPLSFFQHEEEIFRASERSMGVVRVNGNHVGTFFCADKKTAYTAHHVTESASIFHRGTNKVELCMGDCVEVIAIGKLGFDVARIEVPENWCTPLNSKNTKKSVVAYNSKMEISKMEVNIGFHGDETTILVESGRWTKGMSGGPLILDSKPVAVVSAMRGFWAQELKVYALDGSPYKDPNKDEL